MSRDTTKEEVDQDMVEDEEETIHDTEDDVEEVEGDDEEVEGDGEEVEEDDEEVEEVEEEEEEESIVYRKRPTKWIRDEVETLHYMSVHGHTIAEMCRELNRSRKNIIQALKRIQTQQALFNS
jgi:hypothetical protein